MASNDSDRLVRRLRKKLRQIENLEILGRDLNEEELTKVDKKNEIRLELNSLLKDLPSHISPDSEEVDGFTLLNASEANSDEMKRKSTEPPSEKLNENKKPCPAPAQPTPGSSEEGVTEAAGPSSGSSGGLSRPERKSPSLGPHQPPLRLLLLRQPRSPGELKRRRDRDWCRPGAAHCGE